MNKNYNEDLDYFNIASIAKDIAIQIGHPMIHEDYYTDSVIGQEYKYEGLDISYYNSGSVDIIINDTMVLRYDYNSKTLKYIPGKWTQLIKEIYDQIPRILHLIVLEEMKTQNKVNELKSLEEYYKQCVIYGEKEDFLNRLNRGLNEYGISIKKDKYHRLIYSNMTGNYEESSVATTTYYIYYNNNQVADFNGNQFDVLPNVREYAKTFVIGPWIQAFKYVVVQIVENEKKLIEESVDNSADELIRKFRSSF